MPFLKISPATLILPPIPAPPAITNAPVVVLVLEVVLYVLIMSSVTTTLVVTVVSCIVNFSATISPATYKLPPIPAPPATINAPVIVIVADAVFVILTTCSVVPEKLPTLPV